MSKTMEDRHTLSEPRLCPSSSDDNLAWEVEIYRKGVPEPIETIRIDNETLPPRMRKGKVAWRLPSDPGKLPNFGNDERRRIMELFKDKKKSRRKKKQEKQCNEAATEKNAPISLMKAVGSDPEDETSCKSSKDESLHENVTNEKISTDPEKAVYKDVKLYEKNGAKLKIPSGEISTSELVRKKLPVDELSIDDNEIPKLNVEGNNLPTMCNEQNVPTSFSCDNTPPNLSRSDGNLPFVQKYLFVSNVENASPTSAAAKAFIAIYYPFLTNGLTTELCSHFTEKSQKSISVGDAHSVVIGLTDICGQIKSLSGCQFTVRGVVAQDAQMGGIHMLITGVCTPLGGFMTAFAHSVGLVRAGQGNGFINYVIQNDAMSLLTAEMTSAKEVHQTNKCASD